MKRLLLAAALCAAATPALALFDTAAPGLVTVVDPAAPTVPLGTVSHPLNTTGTFSGTISGFQPSASPNGTPVSAQTTVTAGSTQTLPTGTVIVATNVGTTNMAYCQLGATASANSQAIAPNGGWFGFTVGGATQITCVTTASTTTVNVTGGAGIPTGTGGGGGAGGGGNVTVVGPLGTQTNAASVAVTPATSSVWAGPLGTQSIANSQAVTPATSSVWGGPLGTQSIANSQAVAPATSSVWSMSLGPDLAPITGTITANDTGSTSCTATGAGQTICTGTPTPAAVVSGAIGPAACLSVSSFVTSGTPVATLSTEFSHDNVNWLPRGLDLDGKNAPIWINNATGGVFSGQTPGTGIQYYRVRATSFSSSGTFTVTINQSQSACVPYIGNLPTAGNGSQSTASVNIQGGGASALNVGTNQIQQAGVALAAPTAAGSSASGNIQGVQGVTGGVPLPISGTVTASFSQFAPNGNYSTPLTVGAASARTTVPAGGGSTIAVYNVGANAAFVILGNSSVVATAADDQVAPGGFLCLAVGANADIAAIETAGATTLNISGGSGGCAGSGGGGGGSASSNVFQANLFFNGSTSGSATTQILAASGSTVIYLVNYAEQTDAAAGGSGTFQIVTGTGTNCATSQVALTPVWNFAAGQGVQEGSLGVLGVSAAGAAICTKTTTSNQVNWRIGVVQQ